MHARIGLLHILALVSTNLPLQNHADGIEGDLELVGLPRRAADHARPHVQQDGKRLLQQPSAHCSFPWLRVPELYLQHYLVIDHRSSS